MVRRIRFIYRMSFYVNKMMRKVLWKVLEGSRKVRKKPPRKVESQGTPPPWPANPSGGGVPNMASPINFNQFLEKEKLKSNGSNFTDWFRHVRIFLNGGNLQYVLDAPLGDPPAETETDEVKNVYATRKTRYSQVQCAILCSLESDLQKRFEHHDPHELMKELKTIFETHAAVECYEASKHFFSCMMEEGSSISEHMLVMTGHAKKLSDLGIVIPNRLGINRVLQSLPPSYKNFVMNYNMQNMNKEFPELFGMLKAAEIEIKKEHQVLMVNKTTSFKKQGKSKGKFKKGGKKAATPPMKPKNGPKPDADCYYCKEKGHWKRNCSKYLADLKSGLVKKKKEGISDIHVIDVHFTGSRSSTWVFDTGSVAHICNSKQELKNKRQLLKDEVTMRVGNGSKVNVIAVGTLPLHLPSGLVLSLNNCYYVPALSMNIISGSCLMQDGYSFKSENNGCSIFMNNIFYGRAPEKNGLFLLDLDSSDTHIHNIDAKRIKLNDNSTYMWHCRLGHIGVKRMKKLHTDGLLESLDFESLDRCEACLMGKMTKTPFSGMMERATDLLEIIHTDVCGPMSVASRGGYRYVLTFTDDLSRYGYIYLMKHKSETFEKFKEFQSEVENQRNKKIKFLRSDRGGEYLSYEFGMHLKKCGILSQLTPPGTPQRNGVSERRNRTLLDMVRSMMSLTDLPLSFWSYALETAAFTLNRAPSKSVETTPYELWFNKKPKLSFLKVWGCEAYVKKLQPDKLEPKAEKCVFIGYPKETIGYTFYHRSEGKIFVAKNGTFLEKEFLTKEVTGRKVELDEIEESLLVDQSSAVPENVPVPPTPTTEEANDNDHETSNETATEPRRSTRDRATPDWYDPCLNVMIVDNNDEDPATYEEAMMSPDSNKWQEAMKSEMGSMYDNKVWTLVDLPDSRKAVENKWIFKRKTDADGNVTVYKARLVAKGFRQIQGVDYDETFSPVAKLKSVRILLAIAAFFDYEIWQMDVKTAFLNGDIEEELYMVQPKGFVDPKNADKVCKLQRSIYGLKQASRSWNRRFDKVIKDFGFIQCHGEACIYKKVSGSSVAFLILYVDDILLIGNDIELLSSVKGYLNNSFSMKDLGEASYILGIKIYRDRSRRLIGLSQSTYLDKILKKFRMDESKKGFLPMLPGKVLSKTQGPATAEERERMSQIPYASAVGSIMYAMLCTRPDIAHAVSLTSRYQSDPGMEHWTAVKNILKYLKRTKDMFLCYGGDQELVVTSYTDASWNTDPDDSKSQSGYVFILNGAAVSWASSKQCTVAKSSTESEYIAASEASSEAVWMKRFIVELGVVPSALDPFVIYCDNMGAIANAQEPRSHKRLKHIKLRYHSIREYIEDGEVKICKVHTDLNVADPLTKALPRAKHDQHQNAMGVSCMMEEGSSISEHMLVMTGHAKKLSDLGIVIPNRLGINRVLQSLPPSYKNFVMNYNMQNMNKEFPELFGMLKAAEIEIKKEHQVLMVNKTTSFKKQGKSKGKFKKGGKKAATPPMKPKNGPKPDADCYYCKEKGHWKRNCSKYLADLKSGLVKKKKEGISDIHVIDVHFTGSRSSTWVFDTGSVAHICNSKQELKNKRQLLKDEVTMRVGNGSKVNVIAVGTLPLHLPSGLVLSLNNCYYVPALSMNIISGSCLMQDGYSFKSENNGCSIFMNNIFYGRAPEKNGLFLLDLDSSDTHIHNIDAKRIKLNDNSTYMWHCRLGHIGVKRMKKLHTDGLLESLDFESLDRCEACLMGKMTKTPFSGMMERATDLLEIIHTDVCGPMSVASRGGYRYVLTFTDDLSRYGYIYLMKHKSETFEKFKEFQSEVENQRNKKIKFLRSDRGGEYLSYEFGMHLKKCGILSQLTPPGTPQRNVWGCEAYVKKLQPDKLEPKAEKCVFIGYPKETIGYTFYHRSEGKIFVAKNGTFLEKEFLTKESSAVPENVPVPPTPTTEEANDNDHETSNETATEPRRSTRDRATPDWYDPCLNVMIVDNNDEDPATYEEAMMSPDSNKWQEAMKSEMGSMYDNKVWTLVDLPDSRKAVENKWIFKRKTDADGNVTVYKARLVAKGFRQIQGVDYDETFSPVAKLKSVRILLAIAAFFDYEIWQMDVKTAFLNGDIEEELYMVQPKGFVDPKNADKVCKLQRSIYGLKQASRSWNRRFDKVIKDFGFIQCHGEACIYKKVSGSSVAFLILYVDDILLIGNDIELLSSVKGYLNNSFSMKDLGEASYILGIKIYRDRSRRLIGLSQSTYLDKILKKFRMDESKKGFLPMLPGKVLSKTQGPATAEERERMSQIPYASAVGSIMYAMLCTRPDIAHAVSLTSRYQSDPGMEHWTAVKNILKYLKRTKDMFLCYGGDQELVVTSYTDASWNTDPDDSKSQSGYVFILNGAAVSWASSKQCTVAKSSTESEYIAASEASSEAVWMKRFIVELGVVPSALDPFVIYCDNMGAIANAQEPRSHKRLKHIKLRYHSIREYIEDGEVKICKVHTDLNVADPLTKALPRAKHDQHQNAMGVRYITM
ncbi:hypothetical protein QYE76_032185 [Lolium multiflorum]|uniref:Uncharacterized protein n=1 Tax=Lolium multiflorum TaxID=4521 RepID=A0AAD8QTK7_LOLMU|nr:hypothetical protein QYE76_032185 [Lolium multiflorum]